LTPSAPRCKATIEFGKLIVRCHRNEDHVANAFLTDAPTAPAWYTAAGIIVPVHSGLANDGTTVVWPASVIVMKSRIRDGKPVEPSTLGYAECQVKVKP